MHFLVLLIFVFCVVSAAIAQTTGDLEGTVTDQNGAELPVSVELRSPQLQGTRTAVTDAAGRHRLPVLAPGVSVTAQPLGFTKAELSGLKVSLGATTTTPTTIGLSVKEEIVVTSEALVVDTSKTTIGTTATLDSIQRLPLGRNSVSVANTGRRHGHGRVRERHGLRRDGPRDAYIIDGVYMTGVKMGTQAKQLNRRGLHPGGRGQDRAATSRVRAGSSVGRSTS